MEAPMETRVLEYITSFKRRNNRVPYLAEIAEGFRCRPEDARDMVNSLHKKGDISVEERMGHWP